MDIFKWFRRKPKPPEPPELPEPPIIGSWNEMTRETIEQALLELSQVTTEETRERWRKKYPMLEHRLRD